MTFHSLSIFWCGLVFESLLNFTPCNTGKNSFFDCSILNYFEILSRYVLIKKTYQPSWCISIDLDAQCVSSFIEVVTWSEVSWSSSLASIVIGVEITRTDFYDELFSNSGEGTITSSSSTFLPLTSFDRNSFSRKDPLLATKILLLDQW